MAKGDVQIKTPDNVTDEEAATLGISIATVVSLTWRVKSINTDYRRRVKAFIKLWDCLYPPRAKRAMSLSSFTAAALQLAFTVFSSPNFRV